MVPSSCTASEQMYTSDISEFSYFGNFLLKFPESMIILEIFSDGAGRSGVYIVIDSNIELCEEDGVFDVFGYLKKIRGLRRGLVETQVR